MLLSGSIKSSGKKTVHIYSDTSEKAVDPVNYLQLGNDDKYEFIMWKANFAQNHGKGIPRRELCGAILAPELGQIDLNTPLKNIRYYTEKFWCMSKVRQGNITLM